MALTIRDVAKRAETSVAAVSHVLNRRQGGSIRVGEEARKRILEAAEALGYSPNPIARSLATGRHYAIGLVFPYANAYVDQNPFCVHVMNGVLRGVIEASYNMMLFTASLEDEVGREHALGGLQRVDGVVLVCPDPVGPFVRECQRRSIPAVSVVSEPIAGFQTVNADDEMGGYLGARHLIELGHRRIALLAGSDAISTSSKRFQGYRRALDEAGLTYDPSLVVASGFDTRIGYDSMHVLLRLPSDQRPTAVFACNDLCASGAILAIREFGLKVPDDIAVVGYDDTEFCKTTKPQLTSVRMRIDELGVIAVRRLIEILDEQTFDGPDTVLPVSIVTRQSCGASRRTSSAADKGARGELSLGSHS